VCEVDKLEELVTEGCIISDVDQCAIKDWDMIRVSDEWHRGNGERKQTHPRQWRMNTGVVRGNHSRPSMTAFPSGRPPAGHAVAPGQSDPSAKSSH